MKPTRVLACFASVALLSAGLVALLPDCAYACSCGGYPESPKERAKSGLKYSGAVFSGEVQDTNNENGKVTLRTIDVWKGPQRETLEVINSGATCSYPFKQGREYLVYADPDQGIVGAPDQGLYVNLCGDTMPLSEASEDVQALSLVDTSGIVPGYGALGLAGLTATTAFLLMRRLLKIR